MKRQESDRVFHVLNILHTRLRRTSWAGEEGRGRGWEMWGGRNSHVNHSHKVKAVHQLYIRIYMSD